MRGFPIVMLMVMLSSAAIAQTMATPATSPPPAAGSPAASPSAAPAVEGITRDDYIQRAQERAAKAAAKRFDAMDADHDGILTKDEIAAYREAHSRKKPSAPPQ